MARAVRTVDPLSVGSGARVRELFKLPRWFAISVIVLRGVFRHWLVSLSVLAGFVIWIIGIASFFISFGLVLGLWIGVIATYWIGMGGGWKTGWWYFQLQRKWRHTMTGVGLRSRDGKLIPRFRRVRPIKDGLRMDVNMTCAARTVNDLKAEGEDICEIIGARRMQIYDLNKKPGWARFVLLWTTEPLISTNVIEDSANNATDDEYGDYSRLILGKTGSGPAIFSLMLSILVCGLSGSGKSTFLRAFFHAIIKNRIPHELYVIDPAGGVELGELEHYPQTLAYCEEPQDSGKVIKKIVADLRARRAQMKANGDLKVFPSEKYPLRIVLIDEMLMLPKEFLEDVRSDLGMVATTGRKACTVVIGLSALSQVDALGRIRDAFAQRVCFATPSPEATDACLGKNAEQDGAKCSQIPLSTPGVAYYKNTDGRGYTRFRSAEVGGSLLTGVNEVDKEDRLRNRRTAVYKYYNVVGRALRIGIADNPERRAKEYASSVLWWSHVDHTRTQIDWYNDRDTALDAETVAIANERPLYNVQKQRVVS